MRIEDLGLLAYRDAWKRQETVHAEVVGGGEERVLFVEHPAVITLGRRAAIESQPKANIIVSDDRLRELNVEVIPTDRGGDVTLHGPGQLVAYPIVRLNDHQLSVGAFVQRLEDVVIAALADFGIQGRKDPSAIGIWVGEEIDAAKNAALGVRIRRGVSLHGIALNVCNDLGYFDLIVPCGLTGRRVTSMKALLGEAAPTMSDVRLSLARHFEVVFDLVRKP